MKRLRAYGLVLLFAVYPVLALYAHNIAELALAQLLMPLLASLVLAILVFAGWRMYTRSNTPAAILTATFLTVFWFYGILHEVFPFFSTGTAHWLLIPLVLVIYGLVARLILRTSHAATLNKTSTILLIPVAFLVLYNLLIMLPAEADKYRTRQAAQQPSPPETPQEVADAGDYPDIFILVFDELASLPSMQEVWQHDHSAFAESLRDHGFFVAEQSKSRFTNTIRSLPSLMNLDYLDEDLPAASLYQKYDNNFLMNFLDRAGYEIFFIDGWGSFEYSFGIEDINFYCMYNTDPENQVVMDPFHYLVLRRSLLSPLAPLFIDDISNLYYRVNKYFLDFITHFPDTLQARQHPVMLYAHLMTPHLPFVFDRDGNFMENPTNHWEYETIDNETKRALYFEQYLYISDRIIDMVNNILKEAPREPVIMLFSDHGVREPSSGVTDPEHAHRVLNAVYFPGGDYSGLHESTAPVNSLRLMMNRFFSQDYEMLDDF